MNATPARTADDQEVWRLYRSMLRIRRIEEVIADLYSKQQMRCPIHLCIGQEAASVGVCDELDVKDQVFSSHRSHGHFLAKGGSVEAMIAELYGRKTGCSAGKGGSMHLIDLDVNFLGAAPILGATTALAVGAAFGVQLQGGDRVTVAFIGDAATEEGVVYEAMNFSALKKLPFLLICENNGLSTCSPLSVRQPSGRSIAGIARAIGMAAESGNGNDVLEVKRLARDALQHIRSGKGPFFLEFSTYRWREHCGPGYDFNLGYRSESELKTYHENDPIQLLRKHMETRRSWDQATANNVSQQIEAEISHAFATAQAAPDPEPDQLLVHEYAD